MREVKLAYITARNNLINKSASFDNKTVITLSDFNLSYKISWQELMEYNLITTKLTGPFKDNDLKEHIDSRINNILCSYDKMDMEEIRYSIILFTAQLHAELANRYAFTDTKIKH